MDTNFDVFLNGKSKKRVYVYLDVSLVTGYLVNEYFVSSVVKYDDNFPKGSICID